MIRSRAITPPELIVVVSLTALVLLVVSAHLLRVSGWEGLLNQIPVLPLP